MFDWVKELSKALSEGGAGQIEIAKAIITAVGTVAAGLLVALIGTIGGGLITRIYGRERDRQDMESQWRSHAIELTKLDKERLLSGPNPKTDYPFILTFLANYRDLKELGQFTPKELYGKILKGRIAQKPPGQEEKASAVNKNAVSCDGESGDHPKIFLALPDGQTIQCPYCSKAFIFKATYTKLPL